MRPFREGCMFSFFPFFFEFFENGNGSRRKGHTADDLALAGEEGRGRLRKATGSCEQALIRGYPNGETRQGQSPGIIV